MATGRKEWKEQRHGQVRDEILEAAGRVILRRGLAGFTLSAVATELSLTKAALYYYFASKEELAFELVYRGLSRHAEVVRSAVDATGSGAAALEAMIRAAAGYYGERKDELRLSYLVPQTGGIATVRFGPEMFARIRPLNDLVFGSVAARIEADQEAGRVDAAIPARRLAFVAHGAVLGMLTMEGLVEAADDTPLIHGRAAMVDELVAAFAARLGRR